MASAASYKGPAGSPIHDAAHWSDFVRTRLTIESLHARLGTAIFDAAQIGLHFAEIPFENVPVEMMIAFGDQLKERGFTVSYPSGQTAYGSRLKLLRVEWQV